MVLRVGKIAHKKYKKSPFKEKVKSSLSHLIKRYPYLYKIAKRLYYMVKIKSIQHRIYSLKEVLLHCHDYAVISFDFFDTLVHRVVYPPELIKLKTAEYACLKLKALGYHVDIHRFNAIRRDEEKRLRDLNVNLYDNDHETDINAIITAALFKITQKVEDDLINHIIAYELKNEINHLYLHEDVSDLFKKLKMLNKKIIVISDMYLSEDHIKSIATHFRIAHYIDTFYVSSTKKLTKSSGRLYQAILSDTDINPKKTLHIGDNLISDYYSARKNNIQALYYINKKILREYRIIDFRIKKINRAKSNLDNKLIFNFLSKNKKNYPLIKRGYYSEISRYLSPVVMLFSYQALFDLYSRGIKKIYFFAREGFFLKEIFNIILNNVLLFNDLKNEIECKIIHISRLASACARYKNLNTIEALVANATYSASALSIEHFLKIYGLSLENFSKKVLKIIQPHYQSRDINQLMTLLKTTAFGEEVHKLLTHKKKLLEQYLVEQGLLSEGKIGLIDIGWGGTIQKNISHFLDSYPSTEFFGFYFGTNHLTFDRNYSNHSRSIFFPGYIISTDNKYETRKFTGAVPFLESVFGCDETETTIAYQLDNNNTIIPLFQSNMTNAYNISFQRNIKKTILEDIKKLSRLLNMAALPIEKMKRYGLKKFYKFIFNPKIIPIKELTKFKFNYNWSSNIETELVKIITLRDMLKPLHLIKKIRRSPWQYGTLATSPIPFLLYFYRLGHYLLHHIPTLHTLLNKHLSK